MSTVHGSSEQPNREVDEAVRSTLKNLKDNVERLAASVNIIHEQVKALSEDERSRTIPASLPPTHETKRAATLGKDTFEKIPPEVTTSARGLSGSSEQNPDHGETTLRRSSLTSRIILTTYPGQAGIDPIPLSDHANAQ